MIFTLFNIARDMEREFPEESQEPEYSGFVTGFWWSALWFLGVLLLVIFYALASYKLHNLNCYPKSRCADVTAHVQGRVGE